MSFPNVLTLKQDLTGVIHGTTLNQVVNLNGLIQRAANQVLEDVDPQETKRIQQQVVYSGVYDYPCYTDVKGNAIIDIAPQVNRLPSEIYNQQYNQDFDATKLWTLLNAFTIQFNQGVKTVRINGQYLPTPQILSYAADLTSNGTWVTGGGASNLRVDNVNYVAGGGSLEFDLAAGQSTGYLENSTLQAQNLSAIANQAVEFLNVYLPTASAFTNVKLRFGSSASNYYETTTTINQLGVAFNNGWNLLSLPWLGSTVVGTPNNAAITYLRITFTYNSTAQTGVHLNNIQSIMGAIANIAYYSKYLFADASTGNFLPAITDNSNIINLDVEAYALLFNKTAFFIAQQLQGLDASFFDANFFSSEYDKVLAKYKLRYRGEIQKPKTTYYQLPNPGYGKYLNSRRNGY